LSIVGIFCGCPLGMGQIAIPTPVHHHHHQLGLFIFTETSDAAAGHMVAGNTAAMVGNTEKTRRAGGRRTATAKNEAIDRR
ncbi:hypothetical protein A2U01_0082521, partial [Trifolium medium]|nr:hypothetical protein [Trifolium medium]